MSSRTDTNTLDFAAESDQPIAYIQRTRSWYLGLGFDNPYTWAHYSDVPFTPLAKPLAQSSVALITTAAPYQPDKGPQGPGAPYNAGAKFYRVYSVDTGSDHDLRISHVAIDRLHSSMEDSRTWFPIQAMRRAVGRIGTLAPRLHGVPTNRSQRHTIAVDCPEILNRCLADGADNAVLVPNCPVCHQSLSLVARLLEANGIPTVIMGCAKDVVEYCGVPRFVFSDFPLGNSAGRPHDADSQDATLELALRLLESAPAPRTTVQNPLRWDDDPAWKLDYCNIEQLGDAALQEQRAAAHRDRERARNTRKAGLNQRHPR